MREDTEGRRLVERPWAILPDVLPAVAAALRIRADDAAAAEPEAAQSLRRAGAAGATAVIPVRGVITPHPTLFGLIFGIDSSLGRLRKGLRAAVADESVGAIVLDVDSPGGVVDGVPEMAEEIRAARARKPIVAVANTMAASAAYWLAAQATEIVVAPSGRIGSIGVLAVHEEYSRMDEAMGITTTVVRAGRYKAEANPFEPLTAEAQAAIQEEVDAYYDMFVAAVAKGRDVKAATVRDGFGEGRVVMAKPAVKEGMADRVGTVEDAIGRAAQLATGGGGRRAEADSNVAAFDSRLLAQPAVRDLVRARVAASNPPAPSDPG